MAIDGVKIIDSDLAHDIYNEFLDLYDSNLSLPEIRNKIESHLPVLTDDLEYEIFQTVFCQVLWEIGELTETDLAALHVIVEDERGLQIWADMGEDLYFERKKVLLYQLKRLSKPRIRPRQRKKWRKVDKLLFSVGECVLYIHSNGKDYALLVCDITQHRGECLYSMVPIVVDSANDITVETITKGSFVGRKIPSSLHENGFVYGFSVLRPEHRELIKYDKTFRSIGRVTIRTDNAEIGSFGGIQTQKDFEEDLVRILERRDKIGDDLFK